jgi:thiamine kinase-like enzyme
LHQDIDAVRDWVAYHRATLTSSLDRVSGLVDARASQIREERPAVTHGDVSLPNIMVSVHRVQLIDWDFPRVRYPMAELSTLDEHAYLHGSEGLPAAFFAGYGR